MVMKAVQQVRQRSFALPPTKTHAHNPHCSSSLTSIGHRQREISMRS